MTLVRFSIVLPLACAAMVSCSRVEPTPTEEALTMLKPSKEQALLNRIRESKSDDERRPLIEQLDGMPGTKERFFYFWTRVHDTWNFGGWSDSGYDPSKVNLPRDIQLLGAVEYGVSDIENGGLHQFFHNGTGVFAPEMIEWFDRAGMPACAEVMRKAVAKFGPEFPRSQEARQTFLGTFKGESRKERDPFHELDEPFYDALIGPGRLSDRTPFKIAADRWLHETCGITKLSDPPSAAKSK
ncbi:hypothetical protein AYO47_00160 [Planctomyces sp. SCGC AG-212-M04]|nr:hypothetical protein AYO47_00160 [Planctomyces sp. SCGC AG-212-M04]